MITLDILLEKYPVGKPIRIYATSSSSKSVVILEEGIVVKIVTCDSEDNVPYYIFHLVSLTGELKYAYHSAISEEENMFFMEDTLFYLYNHHYLYAITPIKDL